ncbi:MAG: helix-turn-helix transcriptional regulator [Planctomycetia bacterium]|nr:helix-turn-helix transcriptional regulator [Planctomycetia bacterium]
MSNEYTYREQLRRAVMRSSMTQAELSRRTGLAESIISRFVHQGTGVSMRSADKIVETLGLRVTVTVTRKKGG